MLGNCLSDKNYLRWSARFAVPSSPSLQKSETVSEVPAAVHDSRYRAMEEKKLMEARKLEPRPAPVSTTAESVTQQPTPVVRISPAPAPVPVTEPKAGPSIGHPKAAETSHDEKTAAPRNTSKPAELVRDEALEVAVKQEPVDDSDKAKLERKRKQQQKKEEFMAKLKRMKSDDQVENNKPTGFVEGNSVSPVPEGNFSHSNNFNIPVRHVSFFTQMIPILGCEKLTTIRSRWLLKLIGMPLFRRFPTSQS